MDKALIICMGIILFIMALPSMLFIAISLVYLMERGVDKLTTLIKKQLWY